MRSLVFALDFIKICGHPLIDQSAFQEQLVQQVSAMIFVVGLCPYVVVECLTFSNIVSGAFSSAGA